MTHGRPWKNSNAGYAPHAKHQQHKTPLAAGFPSLSFFLYGAMFYSEPPSGREALEALHRRGRYWRELGTFLFNLEVENDGGHNLKGYEKERREINEKTIEIYNQLSGKQKSCLTCGGASTFSGITRSHGVKRFWLTIDPAVIHVQHYRFWD